MTDAGVHPFAGRDVRWLLDVRADELAEKELLVWRPLDGSRVAWTYGTFRSDVDRLAAGLERRGVHRGDAVAIHMDNCPEFLLMWFALHTLGAVMVTTNVRSSPDELTYYLDNARVGIIVTQARHLPVVGAAAAAAVGDARVLVADMSEPVADAELSPAERLSLVPVAGAQPTRVPIDPSAPAGVQFTSGTTSRPKGVVWTQANYLWAGKVGAAHEQLRADDRHLTHLPLFHTNAQSYSVMASLWAGATVVLVPRFSASRFWDVAVSERATWSAVIPFTLKALRRHPVPEDHSFRCWGNGIAVPSWEKHFRIPTLTWWGMTETVSHPIVSEIGFGVRPFAMGRASSSYRVRIVDDSGTPFLGPGIGLLEVRGVRGVSVMSGYLDDDEATAAAFTSDGWLRTGDRVELHDDGWFSFVERDKDMLKIGGENVAALEIERVISTVRGVDEVAVVAGPDPMLDEVPVAFVIAAGDADGVEDDIIKACRSALADFKVPRLVVVVGELPRSTLNKVAKNQLRVEAAARLRAQRDVSEEVRS